MTDLEEDVERTARRAAGIVAGIAAGAYTLLSGLVTFDVSFLAGGQWFSVVTLFSEFVGPTIAPGIPWGAVLLAGALVLIGAILYQYSKK